MRKTLETALAPDLVILSSAAMGGPAGVGALVVGEGVRLVPLIEGGAEEEGLRAELPAVGLIAGFGTAARLLPPEQGALAAHLAEMARDLARRLGASAGAHMTGDPIHRLPGHVSATFPGMEGEALLLALDRRGICASTGSSCAREAGKPSHVLEAIGLPGEEARSSLVFSLGRDSLPEHLDAVESALLSCLDRLRRISAR